MSAAITFDDLKTRLDWDAIGAAVAETKGRELMHSELADAKECVYIAAERWLPRDYANAIIEGTEEEIFIEGLPNQRKPFHGFTDLRLTVGAKAPDKTLGKYAAATLLVDWKTTSTATWTDWRARQKKSWQWKLYAFSRNATLFSYRGINRMGDTSDLTLEVPASNGLEVREFLSAIFSSRGALVDAQLPVWPRNRPGSCNAFGRECPFDEECEEYSMPQWEPEDRQLSYSSIGDYLLCPEKHRRKSLAPEDREETESTIFGQAVHRGLEEVYRQARVLQNV